MRIGSATLRRRARSRGSPSTRRSAGTSCGSPRSSAARWRRCALGTAPAALLLLFVPLLYWQWIAPVRSVIRGSGEPSSRLAYHQPLLDELGPAHRRGGAVPHEIPFTADHWETRWVALRRPLARGWERQLDVELNGLFYEDDAHADALPRWLDAWRSRYVALPGARLDPLRRARGRALRSGGPGLREVWRAGTGGSSRSRAPAARAARAVRVSQMRLDGSLADPAAGDECRAGALHAVLAADRRAAAASSEAPGGWTRVRARPGRQRAPGDALQHRADPRPRPALLGLTRGDSVPHKCDGRS